MRIKYHPHYAGFASNSKTRPDRIYQEMEDSGKIECFDSLSFLTEEMVDFIKPEFRADIGYSRAIDCIRALDIAKKENFEGDYTEKEQQLIVKALYNSVHTYFVLAPRSELLKIGMTRNIHKRFATLTTGSPEKLVLRASIAFTDKIEAALHKHYAKYREHGEWFRYEDEIVELVMLAKGLPSSAFIDLLYENKIISQEIYLDSY